MKNRPTKNSADWRSLLIASVLMAAMFSARGQLPEGRPNVIILFTDDQGFGDLSCHGNPVLQTPALDRLYNSSVRFSDFHVTPLCTPSRGELLTGLDALHNRASTVGTGRNLLRRDIVTMPELFRQSGYRTGIFGKWHLGDNYPDRPMDRGFEKCIWFKGWGLLSESEFDNDYYKTRYLDGLETKYSQKYCTDLWFDEAMQWMGAMADEGQPFFVYLATNAPHGPYYAPREDYQYYRSRVADSTTAKFLGMVRNIDMNTGRLLEWLDRRKLREHTIIVFMNDNGGTGGVKLYNAGMRGMKGSNYEGGHRAACFVSGPEGFIGGAPRTVGFAAQVQDLLPTFIDVLGLRAAGNRLDGVSLKKVLTSDGPVPADRMFVVQYSGNNRPEKYAGCVVWNSWRLVGRDELYNVEADPGQVHNVAKEQPGVLKKLQNYYEDWWRETEPGLQRFVPVVIGSAEQEAVILTSDSWADSFYVNTQWKVAQAGGSPEGGVWHVDVKRAGSYLLELSRWPFHLQRDLRAKGPASAVGGTRLRQGRSLPIAYGCVAIDEKRPAVVRKAGPGADRITIRMDLPAGEHRVRAWFRDEAGRDLCGAYYLRVEKAGK